MASQRLQSYERYLEAFRTLTGTVAHDINNLLSGISGYSDLLLLDLSDEHLRSPVEEIKTAGKRIAALSQLLSAFTDKHAHHPEQLDLNEEMLSLKKILAGILGEKTEFLMSLTPGLWPVQADRAKTKQALITVAMEMGNLMPEGGILRISTQNRPTEPDSLVRDPLSPAGYVVVTAESTGCIAVEDVLDSLLAPSLSAGIDAGKPAAGLPNIAELARLANGYSILNRYSAQELSLSICLPAAV